MRKTLLYIFTFLYFGSVIAAGHLSDKDKKATLKCAGLYYANSMIPQGSLELDKIVYSIAAKKFLTSYLIKEGVKEDLINTELNKSVDELYGKQYDDKKTDECDRYIFKLIPESKAEIDKLVKSGIY
tara:strand:+ start:104 stop:484 length:381 start_codon:yes stop_codon:yes gene_type:complete